MRTAIRKSIAVIFVTKVIIYDRQLYLSYFG